MVKLVIARDPVDSSQEHCWHENHERTAMMVGNPTGTHVQCCWCGNWATLYLGYGMAVPGHGFYYEEPEVKISGADNPCSGRPSA